MKVIAGLGNPGPRFKGTRHNVGFEVADLLAGRYGVEFESAPVEAMMARVRSTDPGTIIVKPLTFMNRSGPAIGALLRYYRVAAEDLLVVVDDVNLPLGRLRARARGSAGGHNGLRSIAAELGEEFPRLRLGVGRGSEDEEHRRDLADHVLARFEEDEREDVQTMVERAAQAAELFIADGIDAVMNAHNRAPDVVEDQASGAGGGDGGGDK